MTVARNSGFQDRIRYLLALASTAILAEVNTTANHAARVIYAKAVLTGTADFLAASVVIMTNTTIAAEAVLSSDDFGIPDTDLTYQIGQAFNELAGVST